MGRAGIISKMDARVASKFLSILSFPFPSRIEVLRTWPSSKTELIDMTDPQSK